MSTSAPSLLLSGEQLERRLEELLQQERFAPPAALRRPERANDASIHARAELDPDAFWAEQARTLHWDSRSRPCSTTRTRPSTSGSPTAR